MKSVCVDDLFASLGSSAAEVELLVGRIRGTDDRRGLTAREQEIFAEMGLCRPSRLIAEKLRISSKTLDIHRASIGRKLETTSAGIVRAWTLYQISEASK